MPAPKDWIMSIPLQRNCWVKWYHLYYTKKSRVEIKFISPQNVNWYIDMLQNQFLEHIFCIGKGIEKVIFYIFFYRMNLPKRCFFSPLSLKILALLMFLPLWELQFFRLFASCLEILKSRKFENKMKCRINNLHKLTHRILYEQHI